METVTMLWRRLDAPGHDACRLIEKADGWMLEGAAIFCLNGEAASVSYRVDCDRRWRSREAKVQGWVGAQQLELRVVRTPAGTWSLNGRSVSELDGCVDLDLGFTPSTNLLTVRRLALEIGQGADVAAAWLDVPAGTLTKLEQRYQRRAAEVYRYDAPRFRYSARLQVTPDGFVVKYPGLWEADI